MLTPVATTSADPVPPPQWTTPWTTTRGVMGSAPQAPLGSHSQRARPFEMVPSIDCLHLPFLRRQFLVLVILADHKFIASPCQPPPFPSFSLASPAALIRYRWRGERLRGSLRTTRSRRDRSSRTNLTVAAGIRVTSAT